MNPYLRISLALLPTLFVIIGRPWLPELATRTPAAFYYPAVFLATLFGGFYAGLLSTVLCSLYTLFFLRPHLLTDLFSDPPGLTRTLMFFTTSMLFLTLVALLEKALKKANKAKALRDEFISVASHELKTPITSIRLSIEVMKSKLQSNPEQLPGAISSLERQTLRQERLVNAMIDLTLIDSGQLKIFKAKCNLGMIVRSACEAALDAINDGEVEYHLKDTKAFVDRKKIEEAIFNLVHNSIKYGDNNPVVVSMIENENHTVIEIRNKGIKIPDKDHEIIFERFSRPTVETSIQGIGLGLYLARHFVELHGGKIEVRSRENEDTIFAISLPNRED